MATVYVILPVPLRKLAKGAGKIKVDANTVLEALLQLNNVDQSMSERLLEADRSEPKKFIKVYLDGKDIRKIGGLSASLANDNKIEIVTAFAGG